MHASDPIPPSASSVDSLRELQLDAKRKKRRALLLLFVVTPLVLGVVGGAWWYFGEQAATEQIGDAWNRSSACLVGPPLAAGDKASLRMRAIQLVAIHSERDKNPETRWPSRCADEIALLYEALRKHGRTKDGDEGLAARAEAFAVQLRKTETMGDVSNEVDGLFDAAAAMKLSASAASLPTPTPEPSPGLSLDSLPEGARITPLQYTLDSVTATPMVGTEIHVMVYDKKVDDKPILCTFTPTGADRCRHLGGELVGKSGLRLGGTVEAGASPIVLAGRDGDDGVYRSDGGFEKVVSMPVQSAYVAKDGYLAAAGFSLDGNEGRFELVEQAKAGAPTSKITVGADIAGPKAEQIHRKQLLWGKLVAQVLFKGDASKPRLQYADLPTHGKAPALTDIAEVNWLRAGIFGCRTEKTMVVGVGLSRGFLTFLEDAGWSSAVELEAIPPAFGCHAGEAVFTSAWGDQQRCTPAGCTPVDGVAPSFAPFKVRESFFADLNGKVLAVASTDGRGGMRYRHASGKNLAVEGGDAVLFDDHVQDGKVVKDSTVLGLLLAGRGRYAVVLLTTPKGVYALRFDDAGKPTPASIQR